MAKRKAFILVTNDLSHPALGREQLDFSYRLNRMRPLVERGYELVVVCARGAVGGRSRSLGMFHPKVERRGSVSMVVPPIIGGPGLWLPQSLLTASTAAITYCQSQNIEVVGVMASTVTLGLAGKVLSRLLGAPLVVNYGDPYYVRERGMSRRVLLAIEKIVLRRGGVKAVTSIDPIISERLRGLGVKNVVFLPPGGFSKKGTGRKGAVAAAGQSDKTVLYAGHIGPPPTYRLDLLPGIASRVLANYPTAKFVVVGTGSYLGALKSMVADRGLERSFEFVGRVPYAEAKSLIRGCSVGLQLLNDMCLGTKVIDYFVEGKPAVMCGDFHSAYHEFLENGRNCLMTPPDEARVADAVASVLGDDSLAESLGASAHATIMPYDWDSQSQTVLRLFGIDGRWDRERIVSSRP